MAGSDWNRLLDRLLAEDLTVAEHRLALALARSLLGWQRLGGPLGEQLLRERARFDGRTFERARDGLIAKGILSYESGGRGRGKRSTYTLILGEEKPAVERDFERTEKPAVERVFTAGRKS